MSRILITSGPTRQYLDPVRFISNASSGRMGQAIARAAIRGGHQVTVVTGPVSLRYPSPARVIEVETTEEMYEVCRREFRKHDGLVGVAAPCDYRPEQVAHQKIAKTGQPLTVRLIETPDIVAELGQQKKAHQWTVGFALETDDAHFRALAKLQRKSCDLVVVNGVAAINAESSTVEILNPAGEVLAARSGTKSQLAHMILSVMEKHLISVKKLRPNRRVKS